MNIWKEPGLKWGIISGLFYSLFLIILFSLGPEAFIGNSKFIAYLAMLSFGFVAGMQERKLGEGLISFGRAFTIILTVFAFTEFLAVFAEWLIYNVFDPSFHEKIKPIVLAKTQESMETISKFLEYGEGDADEILKTVNDADYKFYILSAVQKFVTWLALDFLFALILAAILKKEPKIN